MKLTPYKTKNNYLMVSLHDREGKRKRFYLHRLVYMAFFGDIPKGLEIDHILNDKANCSVSNLRLASHRNNCKNPNSIAASMSKMDYILSLNGKQVVSTTMNNSVSVPANSSSVVTIPITTDLFQLFSGESADAIVNLAFKLAGASSEPVNVGLKVKPYISVNNQQLAYPDYITMNKVLN